MNTIQEEKKSILPANQLTSEPSKDAKAIDSLSSQLTELKDRHLEERFIWITVCSTLLNGLLFQNLSIGPAILIGVGEIIILFCLAKIYGVDWLSELIDKYGMIGKDK